MVKTAPVEPSRRYLRRGLGLAVAVVVAALVATMFAGTASPAKKTTLTFLIGAFSQDLDQDGPPSIPSGQIRTNLYERFFWYPTKLVNGAYIADYRVPITKMQPRLIASYKQVGDSWNFTLKRGVKSCAGNTLTADDVIYTFARSKSRTGTSNTTFATYAAAGIFDPTDTNKQLNNEVVKTGTYTFRINPVRKSLGFTRILADTAYGIIFDSKAMQAHATSDDPWSHKWLSSGNAAGFAAYCLTSVDPNVQEYRMTVNKNWKPQPQFTNVIVRAVPDPSARFQAVQTGAADGTVDLAPDQYQALAKGHSVLSAFDSGIMRMTLNFKFPPWSLPQNDWLRRAVQQALPYKQLLSGPLAGATAPLQGMYAPRWFGATTYPQPGQDLAKARQYMAKAGFPDGKGLEKYDQGLTLYISDLNPWAPAVANQIKTALAQINIPITIQTLPANIFTTRSNATADLPMWITAGNPGNYPEVSTSASIFFQTRGPGVGGANGSNYSNPNVDKLLVQMGTETGAQYTKDARQVQQYLWSDLPVVPIAQFASQVVFPKGVTGWESRPQPPFISFATLKYS